MDRIRLGKTGLMVTRLGFGGIPIQRVSEDEAVAVVKRCLDLGINFFDTANGYTTSEQRIGKAISGRREGLILATKSMSRNPEKVSAHVQQSLKQLGADYIDLYQLHNVSDFETLDKVLAPGGAADRLEEARKAGLVRHIGVTSHQKDVAKKAILSGRFETLMFPLNFIAMEAADDLLPLAREHDVGFIAMKPLAGGMLDDVNLAFKYLLQFSDVALIPGIEKLHEIDEIARVLEGPWKMNAAELAEMERLRKELGNKFCRRCDYCQPCTAGIHISTVMTFPTSIKRLPLESLLKGFVGEAMEKAAGCTDCGDCEERCPYRLPIREMMAGYVSRYQAEKKKYQEKVASA